MSAGAAVSDNVDMRTLRSFLVLLAFAAGCSIGALTLTVSGPSRAVGSEPERVAAESTGDSGAAEAPAGAQQEGALVPVEASPEATAAATPVASPEAPPVADVGTLDARLSLPRGAIQDADKAAGLLDLMNAARLHEGLARLEPDPDLEAVALTRAENLVAGGYFDHYGPDGESAFSELAARGIRYRLAGENLARNNYPEARTVQAAFDGLMASAGHRANILEARFSSVGVVAVKAGKLWVYVTVFMD